MNEPKKLLHERLRDVDVFDDIKLGDMYLSVNEGIANELAEEIERDYIPRQWFEDRELIDAMKKEVK